jgi:Cu/Ag efflux pump CusA
LGRRLSAALLALPGVRTVEQQIGRAEQGEDTWGPHRSEFHVELASVDSPHQDTTAARMRTVLHGFPGVQSEVLTFLGDRIRESITGELAPVVVNVFGDDLDVLDATARQVADVLASVPGAADVTVRSPPGAPVTQIHLRPERLSQLGFLPVDVMSAVQTAYQGSTVAQTYEGRRATDVVVILDDASRRDPESVGTLLVQNATGLRVPLGQLADVEAAATRYAVLHDGGRRRQTVTCNPDRDVVSFVADARRAVAERLTMPPGAYLEFGGEAEAQIAARNQLLRNAALAVGGIVLLLAAAFGSWRNLALVLLNFPLALVGGVLGMAVGRWIDPAAGRISIGTLVGFVTLFGITMRNSIMLVSHFEHLVTSENAVWGPATAMRGATERVMPILMTASVTALGLLPLAIGSGRAGREIEGPMAIVILGGLITSTALNLLVLPIMALRWGRFGTPRGAASDRVA